LVALQKATILGENTTKNINHAEIWLKYVKFLGLIHT
jgi:hypothetical protein